ncbi:dihydroxy-acid dehydratase [Mycobacterium sp. AT1]|uniref:dihydroxy-acid dehydratase n=1 Tax=Mycobacterium sp. AT1 TaxID=1961706 RepID=UPI0009D000BC|nr:dihydroxy-acid dehydratase [Mycobacterium sp. AT1]OPX13290.1 dihydroxy-acid dehydratase [Mycobacterium sp. AT1]
MSQRGLDQGGGALFADEGPDGFLHRAFQRGRGLTREEVRRSPVVGICSSWSELNPCNAGLRALAEEVKQGIIHAGGLPMEFPTISISEPYSRPTSMYLRNLMSMDVEESISTAPIDGVVLLGGCDKTVPAQLMGAISADKPAIVVTAGPREVSCWKGNPLTIDDVWHHIDQRRLGCVSDADWDELEGALNTSVGTCNVLGTAITMAAVAEVLGFAIPGSSLPPAPSRARLDIGRRAGAQIVATINRGIRPSKLISRASLENAFRVVCALGGSANSVVHLEAIAGRAGITIGIDSLREWGSTTPTLARVRPMGPHLLSDLDEAGGVPAVVNALRDSLDLSRPVASGETWGEYLVGREFKTDTDVLATAANPVSSLGALRVVDGNLAPRGALLKVSGEFDGQVLRKRAVVFDGVDDLNNRIDDESLDVDEDCALVLRGVGVIGAPGMPEVGHIPIPAKLARKGVTDMLRITDARMSGTATGCVVLHVTPESAIGGPLAYVRDGDVIELDIPQQSINLLVDDFASRHLPSGTASPPTGRGYGWLFATHTLQPDRGCDFDFLRKDFVGSADGATG